MPLALAGLPVCRFIFIVALLLGSLTCVVLFRLSRAGHGRRLLAAYLRHRGFTMAIVLLGVTGISAGMITWSGRSDVRDIWGSADFSAYWVVADYLQHNGATLGDYHAQQEFVASDIVDHLEQHARLGCMVTLASIGKLLWPAAVQRTVIPVIVASMILLLALLFCWLEKERLPAKLLLAAVILHPFLYFLIYFTYASQATAVILFMGGLLLVDPSAPTRRQCILAGIFIGASIFHYPLMLFPAFIFWAICLLLPLGARNLRLHAVAGLAAMVAVGAIYLGQTWSELAWAASLPTLPGWEWRGLPGALEFIGVRSVLGFEMPEDRPTWQRLLDLTIMVLLAIGLWQGLRRSRLSAQGLSLVFALALMVFLAGLKFLHHIPHATHAVVKALSLFTLPVLILALATVSRRLARRPALCHALILLLCLGQGAALLRSQPQMRLFSDDFVQLMRRTLTQSPTALIQLPPDHALQMWAPLARDERRLSVAGKGSRPATLLLESTITFPFPPAGHDVVGQAGEFYILSSRSASAP